jgi:hypothetical protein
MRHIPALLFCALAAHTCPLHAQPYYQRSFGGFVGESAKAALGTPDNGLIVGGETNSFVTGTNSGDIYLTKYDRQGNLLWSNHYNGGIVSYALDLANSTSLGTVVAGSLNGVQGTLFKIDGSGEVLWAHDAPLREYSSVTVTPDDTIFAVGYSLTSNSDIQLDKFDGDGGLIWSKRLGTSYADEVGGVAWTSDGGAIIAGCTLVGGPENDGLLIKVDASGALQWSHTYGLTSGHQHFNDVCTASAGGYLAVGDNYYSSSYMFAVRVDEAGDTLWTRRFDPMEGHFNTVEEVPGGFLVSGTLDGGSSSPTVLLLSGTGEVLWQSTFPSSMFMAGTLGSHARLADGSVVLMCSATNNGPGSHDCWIAVMDEHGQGVPCGPDTTMLQPVPTIWQLGTDGADLGAGSVGDMTLGAATAATLLETLCGDVSVEETLTTIPAISYHAPAGTITVRGAARGQTLRVHDMLGRSLGSWTLHASTVEVPLGTLPTGLLLATVLNADGRAVASTKIIVVVLP